MAVVSPYIPDANYGGEGGPGFDYERWKPEAQKPLSTSGVTQQAFNADQTNGVGYQLKNSDPNAYKNFTAYGTAIGSGMDEESAKRHSYDANGYANYNYDGSQRSGQPSAAPQPVTTPAAGTAWSPPPTPAPPPPPVTRGLGGTNTGYTGRPQSGIQNTFRGMPQGQPRGRARGFQW